MNKIASTIRFTGRLSVLAALLSGLSAAALAAPSPNLVVSQIYGAGGNATTNPYRSDYVEIFNRGATTVTASGWTIQYGSATSTASWSGKAVLPSFTVEPGQYVLVQMSAGTSTGPALPTPVLVPTSGSINLSGTTGKIALVNDNVTLSGATPATANVVDLVGFGTANGFEGSVAPAPSNTLAIFRAEGGCADTDVNDADFSAAAAAPRTSASPRNTCGGPIAQPVVTSCPAGLSVELGTTGRVTLAASDADSIMQGAAISSAAVSGISLDSFLPAADGRSATIDLLAGAGLADGVYPVTVRFTSDGGQEASCTVSVRTISERAIPLIQGAGATSAFNNVQVITTGVVTHKVGHSYFLQDPQGDGDPSTSDALFIFTSAANSVAVGDLVRVKGTITEYRPSGALRTYTEMKDVLETTVLASGRTIVPTPINFSGAADLPRLEGMLVSIGNTLTVNQTNFLGERGELTLSVGRREVPTNRYRPGTPEMLAMAAANADNELVLDDSLFVTPSSVPYLGENNTVRAGDSVTNLTGVLDYGSIGGGGAGFKLQPTMAPVFSRTNARLAAPALPQGNVKVASANVLNYFTTFVNGSDAWGNTGQGCSLGSTVRASNCRGADNLAEFQRQNAKIVAGLLAMDADVIGLMEIQNNEDIAVDYLAQQLNAVAGAGTYAYVPTPAARGTDAVRVAMLYKPAKVSLVGGALSDGDAVNNRAPMAQTFRALNGAKFSVIVNHLRAKACSSSGTPDTGDGQGCNNAIRVNQAARLINYFVPQVVAAAADPDVLIIGDMNAHGFEDPIHLITQAGFVNELERHVRPHGIPYSYVFDGVSGYLDHALASASLSQQVIGAAEFHTNADEPTVLDYNLDGKNAAAQALFAGDAFRSSDHDPVLVALNLVAPSVNVTSSFSIQRSGLVFNRISNKFTATMYLTNNQPAALTGPFFVTFDNLTPGVTLANASGIKNGVPYIAIHSSSVAAGGKLTVPLQFNNPGKGGISFGNTVYSGSY